MRLIGSVLFAVVLSQEQVMFKFSILIVAVAGLLALPWSAWAADEKTPVKQSGVLNEAKTTAEIVKAVEAIHRDLMGAVGGDPGVNTPEFSSGDIKVFAAWHSPFSGVKGCLAYLYVFDVQKKVWTIEMAKTFEDTNEVSVEFGEKVTFRDENRKVVHTYSHRLQAVDPQEIKDKVSIKLGEECDIEFNRDGLQLTNPGKAKKAEVKKLSAKVKLAVTSDSPFPPPHKGATRPYFSVENNFDKTLHFRALGRVKGSNVFFEITDDMDPLPAGDTFHKCWGFDDVIEEVVFYDFKLTDKQAK